jgi:type VI secretion system protein VasD
MKMTLGRLLCTSPSALVAMAASALTLGALEACGQTIVPVKEPDNCKLQVVNLAILASPRINLANNGEARPVQVRIYQLATDVRLNNASFEQVWKDDKNTLKDDLIKVEELSVYPDSRTDIKFERDEKAQMLAAVALFRTPKGRSWYTVLELPPAPGKGACTANCPSGDCADAGTTPQLNPHFVIWVDGSKIDEGSDRLEDYPEVGRRQEVRLQFAPPAEGEPKGGKAEK